MLFIFRKLRRSFFLPGKVRTYLAYAAGEIVLIVAGILLALQISEWNQERKDRAEETEILLRLKEEFQENRQRLLQSEQTYENASERMRSFLKIIKPNPDPVPEEMIHQFVKSYSWAPRYEPITESLNSLISSGKISLISNVALSYKLKAFPAELAQFDSWHEGLLSNIIEFKTGAFLDHRVRDTQITVARKFEEAGPSNFPFDQRKFLSNPRLEDAVERKRLNSDQLRNHIANLKIYQQSILTLIEAELADRGM